MEKYFNFVAKLGIVMWPASPGSPAQSENQLTAGRKFRDLFKLEMRNQAGCLQGITHGSFAATLGYFGWIAELHFIGPGDAPATIHAAFIEAGLIFPRSGVVVQSLADPVSKSHEPFQPSLIG